VLKPGGIFICSGIIAENKDLVVGRMTAMDFEVLDVRLQEGWIAIAGRAPSSLKPYQHTVVPPL
jgi:ribosomal protein L11 methyltransferase